MSRSELYNRCRHTRNIQHMVIVCQCCEPLFVFNGLWRWTLWLRALSSWRRLDAWGVETGEICVNIVSTLWYDCIMESWYGCSLSKTLVGSCIFFLDSTSVWRGGLLGGLMHVVCVCVELQAFCIFGLNCLLAGRSDALRAMTFTGTKLSWILLLLRGVR